MVVTSKLCEQCDHDAVEDIHHVKMLCHGYADIFQEIGDK